MACAVLVETQCSCLKGVYWVSALMVDLRQRRKGTREEDLGGGKGGGRGVPLSSNRCVWLCRLGQVTGGQGAFRLTASSLIYVHIKMSERARSRDLLGPLVRIRGSGEKSISLLFDRGLCKFVVGLKGRRKDVCFHFKGWLRSFSAPKPSAGGS